MSDRIDDLLVSLYRNDRAPGIRSRLNLLLDAYRPQIPAALAQPQSPPWSQRDAILITYADQVREDHRPPLQSLAEFLDSHLAGTLSAVHLLPFYPWSSDDGFAVKDYLAVAPEYGTWDDIARVGRHFELMFDAVFNHLSAESTWFLQFLADNPAFQDFFVTVDGDPDLSQVVRPRALPLLTEFTSASGPLKVWTTFSRDQVDLNVRNPDVLLALIEVLLFYVSAGARFIRLDAIAYLWKRIGTPCIHLPQTHQVIRLMRAVLDRVAPRTLLITETNVPHTDNLSYFGDQGDEAQMVYNFALPPLTVHSFRTRDTSALSRWAASLQLPSPNITFFNFLASHDGIGLNPVRGILEPREIDALVEGTRQRGGLISDKQNPDGSRSPYEMNINFLDAIADPRSGESPELLARRLLTAYALMFAIPGVPGIYFHSLVGSRGDRAGVEASGAARRINREKLHRHTLESDLAQPGSLRHRVFAGFQSLLQSRATLPALSPFAPARVLTGDPRLFIIQRGDPALSPLLCLHNVSPDPVQLTLASTHPRLAAGLAAQLDHTTLHLGPLGHAWIENATL